MMNYSPLFDIDFYTDYQLCRGPRSLAVRPAGLAGGPHGQADGDAGRTPCINPRCGRTFRREEFPDEVVCGRCFALAPHLRRRYRTLRRLMKAARRKPADPARLDRLHRLFEQNWRRLKAFYEAPQRPLGLDAFLEDMGLAGGRASR